MGLFSKFSRKATYTPDFSKTEYEAWLDFLNQGGTSKEWDDLVRKNGWTFKEEIEEPVTSSSRKRGEERKSRSASKYSGNKTC